MDDLFFDYDSIANLYDSFMQFVPYKDWALKIYRIYKSFNLKGNRLLDLGCGTGNVSRYLSEYGFEIVLVDKSFEMLLESLKKIFKNERHIICSDITQNCLKTNFDIAISIYDTVNHLDDFQLKQFFLNTHTLLKKNGILVFDFNTEYGLEILSKHLQIRKGDDHISYWRTEYDKEKKICTLKLKIKFNDKGVKNYIFKERALFQKDIENKLKQTGFKLIEFYDFHTFESFDNSSERGIVVCQK